MKQDENSTFISPKQVIEMVQAYWNDLATKDALNATFLSYLKNSESSRKQNSLMLYSALIKILFSKDVIKDFFYMMSAFFRMTMVPEVLHELILSCIEDTSLSKEMKHFAYYQCLRYIFLYPDVNTPKTRELLDNLYESIYQAYTKETEDLFTWIPLEKRNKDFIIVVATQVLGLGHGPTKILFDRCNTLATKLNKKVFIINTAEALTHYGVFDWFDIAFASYFPELSDTENIVFKGRGFSFFQCPNQMPQVSIIRELLSMVYESKPWCIISIGKSITSDLSSKIVPTLTIPLGYFDTSYTTFQQISTDITEEHLLWMNKHSYNVDRYIKGGFTYSFKPQTCSFNRSDLNIPEICITCLIIGFRLDDELSTEFLHILEELAKSNIYYVFVGVFDYNNKLSGYNHLKMQSTALDFQDNTLAVCECCDIYLNPIRIGGGTSAAEALYKGVPVVTINYGDVAITAGKAFCVDNYDEMYERTLKLANDKQYYSKMSNMAIERAAKLTDTDGEFTRIIKEMEKRSGFR